MAEWASQALFDVRDFPLDGGTAGDLACDLEVAPDKGHIHPLPAWELHLDFGAESLGLGPLLHETLNVLVHRTAAAR